MDRPGSRHIEHLLDLQRQLEERLRRLGTDPLDVLAAGAAVLAFAEREQEALFPLLPLLDPAAREELGGEHERLDEDLKLLEWLLANSPDSADVAMLADALVVRMRRHIARDGRLLAQAARMAAR